ncbi:mechanosensitive ion channel family protein [Sphingobacterium corticibacter]|uniref:Mechanosensitive ion channel protein n=1 Tax=Sphingobacterium corticibacter TaxID=2171749 RepID=A0A2T8HNB0_9SPHI|nr:mechanosensitive ion channel family protein [Sphingobacterium corticibacter]PVH26939.1 mechanosensitive ion channel protein [Sphingobacterium corticibacter]
MNNLNVPSLEHYWNQFVAAFVTWAPKALTAFVSAVIIYLVGTWLIRVAKRLLDKAFAKREMEPSLHRFLINLVGWALNILLFIVVVTQLGVQTSAFVAMIGAAGLAIGLALQGSLANFAGGILILLLRPFKVGDYISASSGISGTVREIDIFNTRLTTPQNQLVVVPNGQLSNSSITNYTQMGTRRTWFDIGVSYSADLKQAKNILYEVIGENEHAFIEPAPQVIVTELGDNAIILSVRVTTSNDKFWDMQEQLIIECKLALEKNGIEIPFPQTDIHIKRT